MSSQPARLEPTFRGYISTTLDALLLFESCLSGRLHHVARRPHDRERSELIQSGNIFIYEEHSSGIKRWTDGVSWSPSRILGNFLIYRELEKPFPPGEKKRALKKSKKPMHTMPKQEYGMPGTMGMESLTARQNAERALIGSLVDSYDFKDGGLVKKTISVSFGGISHHMVSYYSIDDVLNGALVMPTKSPFFAGVVPRTDLMMHQNFRAPVEESEHGSLDDINGGSVLSVFASHGNPGSSHLSMLQKGAAQRQQLLGNQQLPAHHGMQSQQPQQQQHHPQYQYTHTNPMHNGEPHASYAFSGHTQQQQMPPQMQYMTPQQHQNQTQNFGMEPRNYSMSDSSGPNWSYDGAGSDQYFSGTSNFHNHHWSSSTSGIN